MDLHSFILERALKQLRVPHSSLTQFRLAQALSDVDNKGFPQELFQLSAPMVIRGLLNYGVLQMNRKWIYPFWVHQQLEPTSPAFIPRSQNPLLMNITHRSWTLLGSPSGLHEAIIDPRGLLTPLPREWSVDVWFKVENETLFPSLAEHVDQQLDTQAPRVRTTFSWRDLTLELEAFVGTTRRKQDIVFNRVQVSNKGSHPREITIYVAIRPFNPEGVAPIESIEFRSPRLAYVNDVIGIAFADEPSWVLCQNASQGDIGGLLRQGDGRIAPVPPAAKRPATVSCEKGLAHAVAAYELEVPAMGGRSVHYSTALASEAVLRTAAAKHTWRVSYLRRRTEQQALWRKELDEGARFNLASESLQRLLDASRLTLLQLHDGDIITPGAFLYHHLWIRDAAPMVRALDVMGYSQRSRQVIDGFGTRMTAEGFFRAPDGEWDSNGTVLWTLHQHFLLTRSIFWLRRWYPRLKKAARWILEMRKRSHRKGAYFKGLLPPSISAEHLGPVGQYYWDSFWSLAGLRAMAEIAREVGNSGDTRYFSSEANDFESDLRKSFDLVTEREGEALLPATPFRSFDEGAIGSICCLYPLGLFDRSLASPEQTVRTIKTRFVDERGFNHPIIHSGYNAYLTLQLAHAFLELDDIATAWEVAESVFRQASPTLAFPEAIHPKTGGGAMGDGHHGWAAAEVILFLRDCCVRERAESLLLLSGATDRVVQRGRPFVLSDAPTRFGPVGVSLEFEEANTCRVTFQNRFFPGALLKEVNLQLPFRVQEVRPVSPSHLLVWEAGPSSTRITVSPRATTLLLHLPES